jgi:hypothetical protein|tara:strand:+ start:2056 stop:2322 length:267 start_codon:yes stop_codon:yes gene_type:complete
MTEYYVTEIAYPRVKKTYNYDISSEWLEENNFTWDEFTEAIEDPDHERHIDATDQLSYLDRDSEQEDIDENGDGDIYEVNYEYGEYDE